MYKLTLATLLLLCPFLGTEIVAKDKPAPTKTVVQHNAPLGVDYILAEYYLPVKSRGAFGTTLAPKPYIVQNLDGSKTQFELALVYSGWSPPCCFLPIHIVVDGSDVLSVKADADKQGFGSTISGTVFNIVLPDEVMRKIANGTEVWVTIPQYGEQRQISKQLGPEQLATFKLIVEAYDRITRQTAGEPAN
jgi:hypothetical protein